MQVRVSRPEVKPPPPQWVHLQDVPHERYLTATRKPQFFELSANDDEGGVQVVFEIPYEIAEEWLRGALEVADAGPYREPGA